MNWMDIASIVFVCVTSIHLGLMQAVMDFTEAFSIPLRKFKILTCPKCLTFWSTVTYGLLQVTEYGAYYGAVTLQVLAISFLASYSALWLELLEAYIDTLYLKLYGKITSAGTDDAAPADPERGRSDGSMPEL